MKYFVRPGVILTTICGETLLVATANAIGKCPQSCVVNETAAFYFSHLQEPKTEEELLRTACAEYAVDADTIRPGLSEWLAQFEKIGYLLKEE